MNSDDEMMFHQMTEEMSALEMDDRENEEVIRILVAAVEEEDAESKREGLGPERRATQTGSGRRDICYCSTIILRINRQTMRLLFPGASGCGDVCSRALCMVCENMMSTLS